MRGPKPEVSILNEKEQQDLEALVRRHSTPQQVAQRGRMILAAAAGQNNSQSVGRERGYGSQLADALDRLAGSTAGRNRGQ